MENWAAADIWIAAAEAAAAATCAACGCKGPTEPEAFHRRPQPLTVTPILLATVLNAQQNLVKITEWSALSSLCGRREEEGREPPCPFCDILGSPLREGRQYQQILKGLSSEYIHICDEEVTSHKLRNCMCISGCKIWMPLTYLKEASSRLG